MIQWPPTERELTKDDLERLGRAGSSLPKTSPEDLAAEQAELAVVGPMGPRRPAGRPRKHPPGERAPRKAREPRASTPEQSQALGWAMVQNRRPHIKIGGYLWECAGAGHVGYGFTPTQAFDEWDKKRSG
jgi:hypothetical protein